MQPNCGYHGLDDVELDLSVADKQPEEVMEDPRLANIVDPAARKDSAKNIVEEAKASLKAKGFHPVHSAFLVRCIRFGLDPRNIWGACPTDLMHAFQSGILMYLTKMILDKLTPKPKKALDEYAE